MAFTKLSDVQEQVQEFWASVFMDELRETLLLGGTINTEYSKDLKKGDTVKVSQVNAPSGALKTVGVDSESFTSETLSTSQTPVICNRRAVAAYDLEDLVQLKSQLGDPAGESAIRQSLLFAVEKQVNDHLATLIAPSVAAPDHVLNSVATFDSTVLSQIRQLSGEAKWNRLKPWYIRASPQYYTDILDEIKLTSSDHVDDRPIVAGQVTTRRYGYNILEDTSLTGGTAFAYHPDFMAMVMQMEARFKISDLHSNREFGFVLSVDTVFGAAQTTALGGDAKVISISSLP